MKISQRTYTRTTPPHTKLLSPATGKKKKNKNKIREKLKGSFFLFWFYVFLYLCRLVLAVCPTSALLVERHLEILSKFSVVIRINGDVAPSVELASHVQLREGWPLRELLHSRSQHIVGEYVHRFVRHRAVVQDCDDCF